VTTVTRCGIMCGMANVAQPFEAPYLVDEEEFARISRMPAGLAERAVAEGSMFCVVRGARVLYPSFFADPRFDQRHLRAVCRRLGNLPGGSKWQFFTTRKGSLGGITPLHALFQGMQQKILNAAEGFAER
jgi:hypothetical protein